MTAKEEICKSSGIKNVMVKLFSCWGLAASRFDQVLPPASGCGFQVVKG